MRQLYIKPQIHKFDNFADFASYFHIGSGDLIFTHEFIYESFMKNVGLESDFIFQEKYGEGEPHNLMIDNVINDIGNNKYKRIIAVGGGTVIDIAKLLVINSSYKTLDVFEQKVPVKKCRELIIVPTTCGTGSEVTNLSIVEIKEKHTKMGLGMDEMYADHAVLIPELVNGLPYKFFIFSSVDALIHAFESFVSPKSTNYCELFSISAINIILKGYLKILENGEDYRFNIIEDFLVASNYAGIAFGNTGVGAVHALSYPLGGNYHVPHGEANYQFFTEVFKSYNKLNPDGKIQQLNNILSPVLKSDKKTNVYEKIENILNGLMAKKRLRDYGMLESEIALFTDSVLEKQQRLLVNNYTPFTRADILSIYKNLY